MINYNKIHRAKILKTGQKGYYQSHLCDFVDIGCKEYIKSTNIYHLEVAKDVSYFMALIKFSLFTIKN